MSLDAFRAGVMGASDLLQALRDGGCYLGLDEEANLLDALETQESARWGERTRLMLAFVARLFTTHPFRLSRDGAPSLLLIRDTISNSLARGVLICYLP